MFFTMDGIVGEGVDLCGWLVETGRTLRSDRPTSPEGVALRSLCGAAGWSAKGDDLVMAAELVVRELGEVADAHAETGVLDGWAVVALRDDAESTRRALEEIERRTGDGSSGATMARTLDAMVRDLGDIDAWADAHEAELVAACERATMPAGLRERLHEAAARGWWRFVADAAWSAKTRAGVSRTGSGSSVG